MYNTFLVHVVRVRIPTCIQQIFSWVSQYPVHMVMSRLPYDAIVAMLVPRYMWKVACTFSKDIEASFDSFEPDSCTAWLVANRNFYYPEGCDTPLRLHQLLFLLKNLGEKNEINKVVERIPGLPSHWSLTSIIPLPTRDSPGTHFRDLGKISRELQNIWNTRPGKFSEMRTVLSYSKKRVFLRWESQHFF